MASKQSFILHRKDVTLLTPDGRHLPVALQEELFEDSAGINLVLQHARNLDHVTGGQLLFRTPRGSWDAGTHRLEVNTDAGLAALAITLE